MKKFTSLLCAFLLVLSATAAPMRKPVITPDMPQIGIHRIFTSEGTEHYPTPRMSTESTEEAEATTEFKITVTDITAVGGNVTVLPMLHRDTYYFDVMSKKEATGKTDAQIIETVKNYLEQVFAYYKQYGYNIGYGDVISEGGKADSYTFTELDPATDYVVVAFKMTNKGVTTGTVTKKEFTTAAAADPSTGTFTFKVEDVTPISAAVTVTPSALGNTYYWTIASASYIDGMSDADIVKNVLIDEMDNIIAYYAEQGYEATYADLMSTSEDDYEFDGLDANTTYTALAAYLDENGNLIGKVGKKNFTTPESPMTDLTFTFARTETGLVITPSDDEAYWQFDIFSVSEFAQYDNDADAVAADAYAYYGMEYAFYDELEIKFETLEEGGLVGGLEYYLITWGAYGAVNSKAAAYKFKMPGGETGIESIQKSEVSIQKTLRDGVLYIEKNGNTYNVLGNPIH